MSDPSIAQDPAELFDVVDVDGEPTGRAKPRSAVHRDGDWHRAIHVWVVGEEDGVPFLTFQRRGLAKDTQPGKLDATVGGHVRAGEGIAETVREVEEEIGIRVELADLRYIGTRICVHETEAGILDRELQEVFFLRDERPLESYRPHPAELEALIRVPLTGLLALLSGRGAVVAATVLRPGATATEHVSLTAGDLMMRIDRYAYRVAVAALAYLRGDEHVVI